MLLETRRQIIGLKVDREIDRQNKLIEVWLFYRAAVFVSSVEAFMSETVDNFIYFMRE